MKRLASEGICCDTCPSSNVMLRVVPSLESHPLPRLIAAGVACTVNADDPLLFRGITLLDEYTVLRERMGMTDEQIAEIARTSLRCSACPQRELINTALQVLRLHARAVFPPPHFVESGCLPACTVKIINSKNVFSYSLLCIGAYIGCRRMVGETRCDPFVTQQHTEGIADFIADSASPSCNPAYAARNEGMLAVTILE